MRPNHKLLHPTILTKITGSLALVLGLFLWLWFPAHSKAQTATESNTLDPAVIRELGDKVKQAATKNAGLARETLLGLSQQKRGFIGQVERLTEDSLTVTNRNETEVIPLDETVAYLRNGRPIELTDIAVEDWVVVMGVIDNEVFSPKRILVSSASLRPKKHWVELGTIVEQSRTQLQLLSRQELELSFSLNSQTEFQDQDGQTVEADQLMSQIQVLVVGYEDDEGKTATIIRALTPLTEIMTDDQAQ